MEERYLLSTKHAKLAIKILIPVLIAALSFFILAAKVPEWKVIQDTLDSLDKSSNTVMDFSGVTLATSLAISALPDDFATPLADSLADMNKYFVIILVALFLEKMLVKAGIHFAFAVMVPVACGLYLFSTCIRKDILKNFAIKIAVLAMAVVLVVPCSTHIADAVASDLNAYVEETIEETGSGAEKLNEAMSGDATEKTMFERISDLFQTAIHGVTDLMKHFQNTIRRCMNSIAILLVTNCVMPLLTFAFLQWLLKELFHIAVPVPVKYILPKKAEADSTAEPEAELAAAGEVTE